MSPERFKILAGVIFVGGFCIALYAAGRALSNMPAPRAIGSAGGLGDGGLPIAWT